MMNVVLDTISGKLGKNEQQALNLIFYGYNRNDVNKSLIVRYQLLYSIY